MTTLMRFCKQLYQDVNSNIDHMFNKPDITVRSLAELNIDAALRNCFCTTQVIIEENVNGAPSTVRRIIIDVMCSILSSRKAYNR